MIQIDQDTSLTPLWARSPAELEFSVAEFLRVRGNPASVLFTLDSGNPPTAGQSFQLSWQLGSVTMLIDSSITDIYHIPEFDGSSFGTYVQQVYQILKSNPTISKYFTVNFLFFDGTYGYIKLISRENSTSYSVSVTNTTTFTIDTTAALTDAEYPDDQMQLYIDLFSNSAYEEITTHYDDLVAAGVPDTATNVNCYKFYELPALCRSLMGVDVDFPFLTWFYNSKNHLFAKILAFNSKTIDASVSLNGYSYGQMSLVDNRIFAIYGRQAQLTDSHSGYYKFLVTQPDASLIAEDQPLWLTIAITDVPADYTLYAAVTFDDGSTDQRTISISPSVLGMVTVPGGYRQIGFDMSNPGKIPTKIDLTMTVNDGSGENQYSDTRSYYYDNRFSQYNRYFLFQNSIGGYDTLRCRGVSEFETKTTRQTSLHTRTVDTAQNRGTIEMTYALEERIWTMRTGWLLTLSELNWLRELLLTNYAAEILLDERLYNRPDHGQIWKTPLRSVIVQADSVKQYKEDDGMWALEWKMKIADDQNVAIDNSIGYTSADYYLNSYFEFEVKATALTADAVLNIEADDNGFCYINGVKTTTYNFNGGLETVKVVMKGYNIKAVYIQCEAMNADLSVIKMSGPSLHELSIAGFDNVECGYLTSRLSTLWKLETLIIEMAGEGGLPINDILQVLASDMQNGFSLAFVLLLSETPDAAGTAAKNFIIGSGATCITY